MHAVNVSFNHRPCSAIRCTDFQGQFRAIGHNWIFVNIVLQDLDNTQQRLGS